MEAGGHAHLQESFFFYYKMEYPVDSSTFFWVGNYGKLSSNALPEERIIFLPVSSSAKGSVYAEISFPTCPFNIIMFSLDIKKAGLQGHLLKDVGQCYSWSQIKHQKKKVFSCLPGFLPPNNT